eukprot:SAG11_NODE_2734_length_3030_cov_1.940293_2_plen_250_part_00
MRARSHNPVTARWRASASSRAMLSTARAAASRRSALSRPAAAATPLSVWHEHHCTVLTSLFGRLKRSRQQLSSGSQDSRSYKRSYKRWPQVGFDRTGKFVLTTRYWEGGITVLPFHDVRPVLIPHCSHSRLLPIVALSPLLPLPLDGLSNRQDGSIGAICAAPIHTGRGPHEARQSMPHPVRCGCVQNRKAAARSLHHAPKYRLAAVQERSRSFASKPCRRTHESPAMRLRAGARAGGSMASTEIRGAI